MRGVMMKKTILFFVMIFLLSSLAGEEIQSASKEGSGISENANACLCNRYKKYNETKKIHFSLVPGIDIPTVVFIGLDADFLLKHTKKGNNIYMGLSFYPGYGLDDSFHLPFMLNMVFDFKQQNCTVDYLSLRIAGGIDMMFEEREPENYKDKKSYLGKVAGEIEMSLDLIFVNNMVFRIGLNTVTYEVMFSSFLPVPVVGLGYRF